MLKESQTAKRLPPSSLLGQDRATAVLNSLLAIRHYPPLLFTGPSGVGKRTAALLYAQAANCDSAGAEPCGTCRTCRAIANLQHPDVRLFFPASRPREGATPEEVAQEAAREAECYALTACRPALDPTLVIPIGAVRWMRGQTARPPMSARVRVFIIVQANLMTIEAANALLKTIEELPATTTVILTTDVPEDVPPTIRSRCQTVRFGLLSPDLISAELRHRGLALESHERQARAATAIALWSGSLGTAVRLLGDAARTADADDRPEAPAPEFAAGLLEQVKSPGRSTPDSTARLEPGELAEAALALCGLALRQTVKAVPPSGWRLKGWTRDELCQAMWFLLERMRESGANVHAPLALYELTAGLRACCCPG